MKIVKEFKSIGQINDKADISECISLPELQFDISDALSNYSLEEIINYITSQFPDWKFNRAESRYESCIMAIFEPKNV